MTVRTTYWWICDLCHVEEQTEHGDTLSGWIALTLEHPVMDREYLSRTLCPACVKKIKKEVASS